MSDVTPKILVLSGYRMTSQAASEAVSKSLSADIVLYRIPFSQWLNWLTYRVRRFGMSTLLGHIGLSLYLSLRVQLLRFNRLAWSKTNHYKLPDGAVKLKSKRSLLIKLEAAEIVVLMEPFRLPRSVYQNTTFLEVVWGTVPDYVGDSAGWWEKVISNKASTSVSLVQRSSDASSLTLLAVWKVGLDQDDTIGKVRLRQADVLMRELPRFLKNHTTTMTSQPKLPMKRQTGYSYISPTLWEYLKYGSGKPVPDKVLSRRRTGVNYKIRSHAKK